MHIRNRARRIISMLPLVLCGAGCQTPFTLTMASDQYRGASACCRTLQDIPSGQLSSALDTQVIIDGNSPAYNFSGTGLSYFAAYELPQSATTKTLTIQSNFIQDAGAPNIKDLFFPVVMLLNQQKMPVFVTDGQIGGSISQGMVSGSGMSYVETRLDLRQYPSARYFVLYTRPELFGETHMIELTFPGGVIAAGRAMVQAPPVTYTDPLRASPIAPRGALIVRLQ